MARQLDTTHAWAIGLSSCGVAMSMFHWSSIARQSKSISRSYNFVKRNGASHEFKNMDNAIKCPVCLNANGGTCHKEPSDLGDCDVFICDVCKNYSIDGSTFAVWFRSDRDRLTPIHRAVLSHRLRLATRESGPSKIGEAWMKQFMQDCPLPSPAIQAANIIRLIGDEVTRRASRPLFCLSIFLRLSAHPTANFPPG